MKVTLLTCLIFCLTANLFAEPITPKISVQGESHITLEPQYIKIRGDLKIVKSDMNQSYTELLKKLEQLNQALLTAGLQAKDIQASSVRQGVQHVWENNTRTISGYYSSCTITIDVNKIPSLQKIHNALSKIEEITIQHTEYKRRDIEEQKNKQLQLALKNARTKARLMAQALGSSIGKPLFISESGSTHIAPRAERMMGASAMPPQQDFSGSLTINASVTVDFALK